MNRTVVIGARGQIGLGFRSLLDSSDVNFIDSSLVDYHSYDSLKTMFTLLKPDRVINCVAYTNVEAAENPDSHQICDSLNFMLPYNLSKLCGSRGAEFIHFSTDYVFDGKSETPYTETSTCNPLNYYGKSKHRIDQVLLEKEKTKIYRVQAVYSNHNSNFYKTINQHSNTKPVLNVVDDQITCPTPAYWIAEMVVETLDRPEYGMFNLVPDGHCSFADFAEVIANGRCSINRIQTNGYPSKVERPKNSILDNAKFKKTFGYSSFPHWKEIFEKYKNAK